MDRWDDLRVFLAALQAGSVQGAARRLRINPSTVSRRLTALEAALDVRLFDRTPEGLLPTAAAHAIRPDAELAEQGALGVARVAAGRERAAAGPVRLTLPDGMAALFLPAILGELRQRHPRVVLDVVADQALVDLTRQEADLALRFVRPQRGDLVATRVALLPYGVFASEGLLARLPARPTFAQLDWVGLNARLAHLPEAQWLARHAPPPVLRTNSITLQVRAAEAGLGAILTPRAVGHLSPALRPLPHLQVDLPEPAPVWLVTHRVLRDVPRVAAVWDWLLEMCGVWLA